MKILLAGKGVDYSSPRIVPLSNVRRQGLYLEQLPLANRSREIWGRLNQLSGEDIEFLVSGHIRVGYRQEHVERMEKYARDTTAYDLELELVSGRRLRELFPYLGPEIIMASYSRHDGHANPRRGA